MINIYCYKQRTTKAGLGRVMRCMIHFGFFYSQGSIIFGLYICGCSFTKRCSVTNSESRATPGGYPWSILHYTKETKNFSGYVSKAPYGVPLGPVWPKDHARMDRPWNFLKIPNEFRKKTLENSRNSRKLWLLVCSFTWTHWKYGIL